MINKTLISALIFLLLSIPPLANAERQPAELPDHLSKQLMSNMRDHLEALEEITFFLAESKYLQAADTAEKRLGMSSVEIHYRRHVGKYMPVGMRNIGTLMHQAASDFALSARETEKNGKLNKEAFLALSQIMKQCVACHKAYQAK